MVKIQKQSLFLIFLIHTIVSMPKLQTAKLTQTNTNAGAIHSFESRNSFTNLLNRVIDDSLNSSLNSSHIKYLLDDNSINLEDFQPNGAGDKDIKSSELASIQEDELTDDLNELKSTIASEHHKISNNFQNPYQYHKSKKFII